MQATGYIGKGGGGYSGDGGPASAAQTYNTLQFTLDGRGGAFVPVSPPLAILDQGVFPL